MASDSRRVFSLQRPGRNLLIYYVLSSLLLGPLFFVLLVPRWFRYHTLRYRFDAEGLAMSWGILFRREIHLTYRRIQDIHLTSNVLERWLGLARIQVQTASGSARAEMTLEGLEEFELVRDFLYSRMRGVREETASPGPAGDESDAEDELVQTLRAVAEELRLLRQSWPTPETPGAGGPPS